MEKFKWIDFDPVADGKVKPKGIILNRNECESMGGSCQAGWKCDINPGPLCAFFEEKCYNNG